MKQDPKYKFGDNDKIYHREGQYWLPEDEPVIVFRGKDLGTIIAMQEYKQFMQHIEKTTNNAAARKIAIEHIKSITERIRTIQEFQEQNPTRIGLGCHTCIDTTPHNINEQYKTF